MRSSRAAAALLAVHLAGAPAVAAQQPPPAGLPGCYALELSSWRPPLPDGAALFHTPPAEFRLRSDTIDAIRFRAEPPIRHPQARGFARAWWEQLAGDSVRVVWSDTFTGAELRAQVLGDSLVGRVSARSDEAAPLPIPAAIAVARRTACP